MTHDNTGGPAFPLSDSTTQDSAADKGMTLRQYAAIKLRVPDSGTDWLDDMIREGRRMDYAGQALAGYAANCDEPEQSPRRTDEMSRQANRTADAMLAASEAKP